MIPAHPIPGIVIGLVFITLCVLLAPFKIKLVEHNLETFFLVMGVLSVSVSGLWSGQIIMDALKAPVIIGSLPIGIFQVVLVVGFMLFFFQRQVTHAVTSLANRLSMPIFVFLLVAIMGLLSSVISVIVASVLLAEIVTCLPLARKELIKLVVVVCFSVGLGAVLTPVGEPLSTILVQKLSGAPFYAGPTFPLLTFGKYVIPGVLAVALFGALWIDRKTAAGVEDKARLTETPRSVVVRSVKVYAFVSGLVLLGEGMKPLVVWFFSGVPAAALYWINMLSSVLDNATLTSIEVAPSMTLSQITAIILGLSIAGGILIPGNIPNIVIANRLQIRMREWAIIGIPVGLVLMAAFFVVLMPVMHK